jgi:2-(1,2-epoxy-1,2-dihydrophenyl)acetyl-CoA isomerase
MSDTILLQVEDRTAFVTFNRPACLNAVNLEMARALRRRVDEIAARDDVRACVLRGAGAAFMAGGDVELFRGGQEDAVAIVSELIDEFHALTVSLQQLPQPVIASIHGAAAGGGFSLALGADIRIAADTAAFTPAYLRLGTSPDGGGTFFLPRLVGPARALEMFWFGGSYSAGEMARLGLVNQAVAALELETETRKLAERLTHGPSQAVSQTKALLMRPDIDALKRHLDREKASFLACVRSPDFAEGVSAFLSKRPPRFGG